MASFITDIFLKRLTQLTLWITKLNLDVPLPSGRLCVLSFQLGVSRGTYPSPEKYCVQESKPHTSQVSESLSSLKDPGCLAQATIMTKSFSLWITTGQNKSGLVSTHLRIAPISEPPDKTRDLEHLISTQTNCTWPHPTNRSLPHGVLDPAVTAHQRWLCTFPPPPLHFWCCHVGRNRSIYTGGISKYYKLWLFSSENLILKQKHASSST